MRKQVFGRQFGRTKNQRKALFNGLISAMILRGKIKTTEAKAKAVKSDLEKLVTKAKKEEKKARSLLQGHLKPFEIEKMVKEIGPGFKNRAGGYTRIIKTGTRLSDNASTVVMQWSEMEAVIKPVAAPAKKTPKTSKPAAAKTTKRRLSKTTRKAVK